jgi:hypothetical protein
MPPGPPNRRPPPRPSWPSASDGHASPQGAGLPEVGGALGVEPRRRHRRDEVARAALPRSIARTRRATAPASTPARASTKLHEPTVSTDVPCPRRTPAGTLTRRSDGCSARMGSIASGAGPKKRAPPGASARTRKPGQPVPAPQRASARPSSTMAAPSPARSSRIGVIARSGSIPDPRRTLRPMTVRPDACVPRATRRPRRSATPRIGLSARTTKRPGEALTGATTLRPVSEPFSTPRAS